MPTIKVNDWTKDQLEDIKEEEDHSSFDSVIKSLLKERDRDAGSGES
jgi:predicted CopG family antitoxin